MTGSLDLDGRTVVVTSSSRNLGATMCRAFAAAGANVVVNYHRSEAGAERVVQELRTLGRGHHAAVAGDLNDPAGAELFGEQVERTLGPVHVLVNNSGPFSMTPFVDLPLDEWLSILHGNVTAAYVLARRFVPGMRQAGWGRIINIGAGSAYLRNHSIYGLSKAALLHFTEALALEVGPAITVNAIAPGQIDESAPEVTAIDPTFIDRAIERTPAGRLVRREEVAGLATALCSPAFDLVTGTTIPIDGGWRLNRF